MQFYYAHLSILMQLSWHPFSDFHLTVSLDEYNEWPQLMATPYCCSLPYNFVVSYHSELSQGTFLANRILANLIQAETW